MYKEGLALDNLQWLICHKTKPKDLKSNAPIIKWDVIKKSQTYKVCL